MEHTDLCAVKVVTDAQAFAVDAINEIMMVVVTSETQVGRSLIEVGGVFFFFDFLDEDC